MEKINVNIAYVISKPINVVFNGIIKKKHLTKYFASDSSSDLQEGITVKWYFEDYDNVSLDIKVIEIIKDEKIVFEWSTVKNCTNKVEITFEKLTDEKCQIKIIESDFSLDKRGVEHALEQTKGWTDFICSLKAYLYANIKIRDHKA